MALVLLCLFFAITVTLVVRAEGNLFTKEEAIYLDDTIRAVVDDMLARQASVYDARITKLETLHQQQDRKIRILETREKRQRKTIQNLTSMVSGLTSSTNIRQNQRTTPSQTHETKDGQVTVEIKAVQVKKSESWLQNLKPDSGRKARHSSEFNLRAIVASENVAFTAYLDHDVDHMADGHTIKFNRAHLNDGNGYNTFTGVFSTPVSGVYLFTYHWNSHFRKTLLELMVDGVQQGAAIASPVSNHEANGGQTVIVHVNAGQSVWIEDYYFNDGDIHSGSEYEYGTFAGILLY